MPFFSFAKNAPPPAAPDSTEKAEAEAYLNANVRHYLPSYLLSLDDEPFKPSQRLMDLGLEAARRAYRLDMNETCAPFYPALQTFMKTFPGEHYKLLAALVDVLRPRLVLEIGTYQGASCLSMKSTLPEGSRIITYDVLAYDQVPDGCLRPSDFDDRLEQRLVDLADPAQANTQMDVLENADFIFVDAAKDGDMERAFIALFDRVKFKNPPVIMFDDIRFQIMIPIWREIRHPKMDITSFGHWSGTGLVDWV